jgi:hypothetical protein
MTALSDQCGIIRKWLDLGDEVYPDEVVTSWIRMAEEQLSKKLRCKDMIQIDTGLLIQQRYLLPSDWRAMDFLRVIDGKPLRYSPRDDFYNPDRKYIDDQKNCYTIIGNYIIVTAYPDGRSVEISYYQDIPALNGSATWLVNQYYTLFLVTTLNMAAMYAIEDERQPLWSGKSDELISDINSEHASSKASGSRLTSRHRRSFG